MTLSFSSTLTLLLFLSHHGSIASSFLPIISNQHFHRYHFQQRQQQHHHHLPTTDVSTSTLSTIFIKQQHLQQCFSAKTRLRMSNMHQQQQSMEELQELTVEDLKDVLRSMKLKVSGKKSELVERIMEHRQQMQQQQQQQQQQQDGNDDKETKKEEEEENITNKTPTSKKQPKNTKLIQHLEQTLSYEGRISSQSTSQQKQKQPHRTGFISIVGAANMGKSTLLNSLLSQPLCVTTHRPQTTRHAIRAILNDADSNCQLCLIDTPGVIDNPSYLLQEGMMEAVRGAVFRDADVILVVTDLFSTPIPDDELFGQVQRICALENREEERVVIVVVNKVDLVDRVNPKKKKQKDEKEGDEEGEEEEEKTITVPDAIAKWRTLLPNALAIIPTCASQGSNDVGIVALRSLLVGGPDVPKAFRDLGRPVPGMFRPGVRSISDEEAMGIIPFGPPLYDEDMLTDRTERFFASEIIRSSLFEKLGKELPYCCEVRVTKFKEPKPNDAKPMIRMDATIFVERDSQKGIVVGKGGQKVKDVGMDAREKLEEFFQEKVHLNLSVKVDKDWRKDKSKLKAFGYLN